jgi:isoleucyl-tRNA synthetase
MFPPFPEDKSYPHLENDIQLWWDSHNTFQQSLASRQGAPTFTFYEGPPTVNGKPGIHHLLARTIKDAVCRFRTQKGFYVRRQAGWDTHGLPVELAVEKELGFADKKQIEEFGVDKFNAACRDFVDRNISMNEGWRTLTRRMGYWLDLDSAYITCTNNYIESVWWALSQFHSKGLITRGFKVVPQSPTLGTPLSSHELSLNYKNVQDANCYLAIRVTQPSHPALKGASILVWTTTPWTLFGNVALAVGPEISYVVIATKAANDKPSATYVLAEARLELIDQEYDIVARLNGSDIVGTVYEQIFDDMLLDAERHPNVLHVLSADFVTTTDGSGVVHIAPAFGQDDFEVAKAHNLPVVQPVTPTGRFTDDVVAFAGRTVKTFTYPDHKEEGADRDIVRLLKQQGKIYRSSFDYMHSYPHCWRTDNPVIYYARDSWFITSPSYRDELVQLNATINWHPEEIGSGRFGNWLEEVKDWSLSRDRYWGTPLPIWVNENDEHDYFAVGSIDELMKGMYELEDGSRVRAKDCGVPVDLHRPFVDRIVFERNGTTYRRVREVIDVWFDSGSMPFAQMHYPFENKEEFEKSYPADFIAEGIDQTRGWFYTLHNIGTALFGKPAYKHVVVNDLVLDKQGQKMSKSKGNTVDPFVVMERYGADAVRWYLMSASPVWKPKSFNEDDIAKTVLADFFRSLVNTYGFFAMYANIDSFRVSDRSNSDVAYAEIDRWILSRCASVRMEWEAAMESYDITRACRCLQDYVIDDVSNWYVRRNRRRFWKGAMDADKRAAYVTLHRVLVDVVSMTAPVAPFLSEWLYRALHVEEEIIGQSVHCSILRAIESSEVDTELEARMKQAQTVVSLARSLREKAKIKTRQPLRRILLPVDGPSTRRRYQKVEDIIAEELNVKLIEYVSDDTNIVRKSARPNFKVIGKKYGGNTQGVATAIKSLSSDDIRNLEQRSVLAVLVNDATMQIDYEDVEIVSEDIEGWLVASEGSITVALDTEIDDALITEGIAREFVSKIQKVRKDSGFDVTDRIRLEYSASDETSNALMSMRHYIERETLAIELERVPQIDVEPLDVNGREVHVRVVRA